MIDPHLKTNFTRSTLRSKEIRFTAANTHQRKLFLYGSSNHSPPAFNKKHSKFSYPAAQQAFQLLDQSLPRALLSKANAAHRSSVDSFKPSMWTQRSLALNLSTAMVAHATGAIAQLQATTHPEPADPPFILGYQSPKHCTYSFLDPLPHYITTQDYQG